MTTTSQAAPASMAVLPRPRRLPLAQLLFAAAGVALLVVGGAYVLRFVAATAFHKERAFRVLDEIGGQFDNLQRTLTNQLRLMPAQLAGQPCVLEFQGAQPGACSKRRENYQKRLALQGPVVGAATVSKDVFTKACAHVNRYGATLRAREPAVPFTVFSCSAASLAAASDELSMVAFQGSMTETIEGFLSQEFFDEVLVALGDGTVIATVSRRSNGKIPGVYLHAEKPQRLGVADVAAILRKVRDAPSAGSPQPAASATALPSQPEIFALRIADDNYRAFVRAVQPRYGMYVEHDGAKEAVRQERLYLVGLKREDLRTELGSSMEPGARFLLTVLTLLAFLIWPLANLRAKSPDDPITWTEAVACLASVVLIPAVLAIAAVWVWSYQGLLGWTDAGAKRYAREIETVLGHELQNDRRLLTQYRAIYDGSGPEGPLGTAGRIDVPIRYEAIGENGATNVIRARATTEGCGQTKGDSTCVLSVPRDRPIGEYGLWSPLASVFSTNGFGIREGLRFTVYDPPQVKTDASYDNREYFRALRGKAGWTSLDSRTNGGTDAYVAQRIFSGGDGARVLQVAVPRGSGVCATGFCGIVSGGASVHSLSAAVSPPLLSFAVIDRNSGLVIFHSDDSRSLAENFFVETERNSELLALSSVAQSGSFSGHYMGSGHRFHHLPMTQAPWSVVVFYSVREVGDLPWHAVFTALAAYAGALLILLIGSGLVVWLWAKRNRESVLSIAAGFWVRAGSSCSYARWALGLFGVALCVITLYELWAEGPVSLITQVMWALFALASVAVLVQHRFAQHGACITIWLLLLSGIPAAWMALGYHDVQVQGLLRDGLVGAAHDIERRHAVIAGDLRRWLSAGEAHAASFPDPWSLTKPSAVMPVPGYAPAQAGAGHDVWAMSVFDAPPLGTLITHRELDFWRRETWDAAVQAETQQRRIRLLGRMSGWNPSCASDGAAEQCDFRTADGHAFSVRAQPITTSASGNLTEDDDTRFVNFASVTGNVAALLLALAITWMLSLFVTRRLLGERLAKHAHGHVLDPAYRVHHSFVFHSRRLQGDEVERLIRDLRPGSGATPPSVTRVNLATKALYTELTPERRIEGRVLLTNLDIALADAGRRQHILDALERLVDDPNVELLILCRRSPIERLYHPQRYPESGPAHLLAVEESLRWDNVLQKFECRNVENVDRPRTHPHLATVDHHRTWKLCTRSERLLLYELARGRLANPRNTEVIDALLARGLLKLDPWPKVADEGFAAFVRTAETSGDVAQWQQDAARTSGGRWRSTLVAVVLVTVLLTVLWFSWSAGDTFKIVSTVVAGAVAFLGHIGQAFNFVRSNSGGAR